MVVLYDDACYNVCSAVGNIMGGIHQKFTITVALLAVIKAVLSEMKFYTIFTKLPNLILLCKTLST